MTNSRISVTKPYLPNRETLNAHIDRIYDSNWLTNNGPLVQQFEKRLADYLGVKHLLLTTNGTLALQVGYKTLGLTGEVITTPFSFVATTSSLVWEGLQPVFADIDADTFTLDPEKIEQKITDNTSAILPVHVYGNACDIDKIQSVAEKYSLKVLYDAAHTFGVNYKGKSILENGDISILSFHATKLFHSIEGGALIFKTKELYEKAKTFINFGIMNGDITEVGINAKMNEFQAAMGLSVLDEIDTVIAQRKRVVEHYNALLENISFLTFPKWNTNSTRNYAYFPVVFESESQLLQVVNALKKEHIFPRRYFYPSLNELPYVEHKQSCPVSELIARRVLCLPLYTGLESEDVERICNIIIGVAV